MTDTGLWLREHSLLHTETQFTAPYRQGILPFYRAADWAQVRGVPPNSHCYFGGHNGCLSVSYLYGGPGAWCAKGIHEVKCIMGLRCLEPSGGVGQIGVPRHEDTIRRVPGKTSARREGAGSQLEN